MADNPTERRVNRFDPTDTPESDPVPTGDDIVHRQKSGHETPRRYDVPEHVPVPTDDTKRATRPPSRRRRFGEVSP